MKKNTMMRIASCLLIAVLMTTCVISGTFAKYVTTDTATDSARVAKWGVVVAVEGNEAFATEYTNDVATNENANAEVKSLTTESVVAPGTAGTLATVDVSGKPEVAVNVSASVNLDLVGNLAENAWIINTAELYCPLVITVAGTEYKIDATNTTLAKLEAAVEEAVIDAIFGDVNGTLDAGVTTFNADYAPNKDFGTAATDVTVTWAWAFNDAEDAVSVKDTALGDAATASTIEMTVEVKVSQIDTYTAP